MVWSVITLPSSTITNIIVSNEAKYLSLGYAYFEAMVTVNQIRLFQYLANKYSQ